jgi:hypothetical protein
MLRTYVSLPVSVIVVAAAACGEIEAPSSVDAGDPSTNDAGDAGDPQPPGTPDTNIISGPPLVTRDAVARFEWSASELGSTFRCELDGAAAIACTSPFTTPALGEGAHELVITAVDLDGNVDPSPARATWTVDQTLPQLAFTGAPPAITNQRGATLTWTSNESASFSCKLDNLAPVACGIGTSGSLTVADLAAGNHTLTVTGTDAAGNQRALAATWAVDFTPPTNLRFLGTPPAIYGSTVTYSFSASEAVAWECTTRVESTGAIFDGPRACGQGTTGSIQFAGAVPAATIMALEVRATDPAGNGAAAPLRLSFCRGSASTCVFTQ